MSWITITIDPSDKKVNVDRWYLIKIVISTIRIDQFLYISLKVDYKYSSNCYSVSFSIIRSFSLKVSLLFYTIFPFHLYFPRADQIVGVDLCPISLFRKSLGSSCKVENYCSGITSSLMRPES